jgi:hypothetical protein
MRPPEKKRSRSDEKHVLVRRQVALQRVEAQGAPGRQGGAGAAVQQLPLRVVELQQRRVAGEGAGEQREVRVDVEGLQPAAHVVLPVHRPLPEVPHLYEPIDGPAEERGALCPKVISSWFLSNLK